jgi:CRISPR/Cas system CSM-associated protein Csm5 (group 7 of RAMP superfamily)
MSELKNEEIEAKLDEILSDAVDELNSQLDKNSLLSYENKETVLLGEGAAIDSMTFVTFIVIIEDLIFDEFGKSIKIVSPKAFSEKFSPFKNFITLKAFIAGLLED